MPISIGGIKVNTVTNDANVHMAPLTVEWAPFSFIKENIAHLGFGDHGWLEEWAAIMDEDLKDCLWGQRK
jgi:hypothetical protein